MIPLVHDQVSLAQLSYAVALDHYRHFGRAADACHVTQPTLSTQVQQLEEDLGIELFDRSQHPVEPTDLGSQIIEQARTVLDESARIPALVERAHQTLEGELRVGMLPTLAPYLLPLFVSRFRERYGEIRLVVEELRTDHIVEKLRRNELDVGLIATTEAEPSITAHSLFREPFVGYLAEEHPLAQKEVLSPNDLDPDDLWLLKEGHCFRDQTLQLCNDRDSERARGLENQTLFFESGNLETCKTLVERYGGLTLLPTLATITMPDRKRTRIRPFREPPPTRKIRLLHRRAYLKQAMIEALANEILRALPDIVQAEATSPVDLLALEDVS